MNETEDIRKRLSEGNWSEVINGIVAIVEEKIEESQYDSSSKDQFNSVISAILQAVEWKDYLLAVDIIEYELLQKEMEGSS